MGNSENDSCENKKETNDAEERKERKGTLFDERMKIDHLHRWSTEWMP